MTNSGEESTTQASAPAVVYEFGAKLIAPAFEALMEGRNRFGLTDNDLLNQAFQLWMAIIRIADTADLLARERETGKTNMVIVLTHDGQRIIPPAA